MRTTRTLLTLCGLGTCALAGYHLAARAGTYVASTGFTEDRTGDLTDRFPDMGRGTYSLANLTILDQTLEQISERYVDPERLDYPAMFKAGLEAVEHDCPEVLLRVDGDRLHVQVDRYSTSLQLRPLESPEDVVAESRRVAQILEAQLPKDEYKLPDIEYTMVNGMLTRLDPHSVLFPPVAAKKFQEDNDGSFGGLGISIRMNNGELTIDYPMVGTPAETAGLKPGDTITRIDGEGTFNMDIEDAVAKMRGPPASSVTLTVAREGWDMARDVKIVRDVIKPAPVWGVLLEGNVGYVEIPGYNDLVSSELETVLGDLSRKAGAGGLKGVILDMRDNPGGYLHRAIEVADKFLDRGVIVSTVGRNGSDRKEDMAKATGTEPNYPMAVLMSGNSASAAEIVAGALKNSERAVIIGERSFGKGSVQEINHFGDGSDLKFTVARYLTPGDHWIQEVGIPPDIEVKPYYVLPPRDLKEYGVKSGPFISLFSRDHLMREGDLSGAFSNKVNQETPPVYSMRYLAPDPMADVKSDRKDVKSDFEVLLARDVLLASHGGRRADVLKGAESVVAYRQKQQDAAISTAFSGQKIDWAACAPPSSPAVDLKLEVAKTGTDAWGTTLTAGDLVDVRATLTNKGTTPMCQAIARAASPGGNDVLDGAEFYFGKVNPGETRTYLTRAKVPGGYPEEIAQVALALTDVENHDLLHRDLEVTTHGTALPRYGWDWSVDDKAGGDGDGLPELGETITLNYTVKNLGDGPGGEVTFNLRKDKDLGKAVELKDARFEIKALAAGASAQGHLSFKVLSVPPANKLAFELSVRDNERYDYATLTRGGFYSYFVATEPVNLEVGKASAPVHREPPKIELTRQPDVTSADPTVTLSGVVSDDDGVRDVILYQGQQKLAYAGGAGKEHPVPTLPFTASAELAEGNNILVIAARDVDGFTTTRGLDVLRRKAVASAVPAVSPTAAPAPAPVKTK